MNTASVNIATAPVKRSAASDVSLPAPCVAFVTPCKATYFKPLYEAFAGAQPRPWKTVLLWPDSHDSEHPEDLLTPVGGNIEIRRVGSRKITGSKSAQHFTNWRARRRFLPSRAQWRTLCEIAPRLVMIQEYSPFALGALLYAKLHRVPVVAFTEVGSRNAHFFSAKVRLWHAFWSRWVDGIVAACPTAHEPLSGKMTPSFAAYHAADSRLYTPVERINKAVPVTFVYAGQLIGRKGIDLWFKAARELKTLTNADFRLRIIGGGDETWARGLAIESGLEQNIEWCGFQSGTELREAMCGGDVFVLPSRQDTYAVVTHEAACLGLPLLVSKHAGSAEALVRDGVNGFVIDPEDAISFMKAMQVMLDAGKRASMSAASRAIGIEMSAHRRGAGLWEWMQTQFQLQA